MSKQTTRREFLHSSAIALAAAAAVDTLALPSSAATRASLNLADNTSPRSSVPGEIGMWVTNDTLRFAKRDPIRWQAGSAAFEKNQITLNPNKKFQEILGFGGALTDAACYMLSQLPPPQREQLFHELFHPSEMGLNVCRTCIGASDYSKAAYSYDEGEPDLELKRFSIAYDREYILPMLREARKANPDLFLFSSPWSPPGWMKSGGSMLGGSMRRRYLHVYAEYFQKFLQAYEADGVPIQAVTVQNEVDTDQDARMPACIWPQEYEMEFVRDHLGPLLERNGAKTKIWVLDHNYNLWGRAVAELDDPGVRKYAKAIAWHGYVGTPDMMTKAHEAHPEAAMYWTEGGPDYIDPDYLTSWAKWGTTFTDVLRNWCSSITTWNVALDEVGRPNIGPFKCGGFVSINSRTKEIARSGQYWGMAHFSRAIRRGARRFESEGALAGISHASFDNPDGTRVLVLTNSGDEQKVSIQLDGLGTAITLDRNSVATLVWS